MDVDISPDGKTILFDLVGDLYTVPVEGGKARQMTRGMAVNFRPVWSPDGRRIAYVSDYSGANHINLLDENGGMHKVLGASDMPLIMPWESASLVWSPDGRIITGRLFSYDTSGQRIELHETRTLTLLRYRPDMQAAYYISPLGDSVSELISYEFSSKKKTTVLTGLVRAEFPAISPDFRWLTYIKDTNSVRSLIARDLGSGKTRVLMPLQFHPSRLKIHWGKGGQYIANYVQAEPRYSFSSDSRSIFIGDGGKIHRVPMAGGPDQIIPFIAEVHVDMAPRDYHTFSVSYDSVRVKYTRSASMSADGRKAVFSALDRIYIKNEDRPSRVICSQPFNQFQPVLSPDGKWVAYVSLCDTAGGFLWRVLVPGGAPQRLTTIPGQYQHPAWSPDGRYIAYIKGGPNGPQTAAYAAGKGTPTLTNWDGIGQLQVLDLATGSFQAVADSVPTWTTPSFSADGQEVMYQPANGTTMYQGKKAVQLLVAKNMHTRVVRNIAIGAVPFADGIKRTIVLSPDRRYLAYSMDEDIYLQACNDTAKPFVMYSRAPQPVITRLHRGVDPVWSQNGKTLFWSHADTLYGIRPDNVMNVPAKEEQFVAVLRGANIRDADVRLERKIHLDVSAPYHYGHGTIVLMNVRIVTMQGDRVIERGTVVIKDGRFAAVGPVGKVAIPKSARVLDLTGKTIIPGFIDLHLHWHAPNDIFPQQYDNLLTPFAYGVTTARDPSSNYSSFGYEELLKTGQMIGPREYSSGTAMRYHDGVVEMANFAEANDLVMQRADVGGTFTKQYTLPDRIQREWLVTASRMAGLNMTNEGSRYPLEDIGMIKDGNSGIEHVAVFGEFYKDYQQLFAHTGVYLTPTLQVAYGVMEFGKYYFHYHYGRSPDEKLRRFWTAHDIAAIASYSPSDSLRPSFLAPSRTYARIRHLGGKVTLGSHGEDPGIGVHYELWAMQMGGLTNLEALQAATIMGAEAIGIQKDVGSIEPGKIADLIVLNRNPLEDIHYSIDMKYVMRDGILYDANTLDEVWPVERKCPVWKKNDYQD